MTTQIDPGPIYLDCNATTPVEPAVAEIVCEFMKESVGNAGSRTHVYGNRAKELISRSRRAIARALDAEPGDVIFTSGATESNNLALLGLVDYGIATGRRHIVSTAIEHKAVLEPLNRMRLLGFEVELIRPEASGAVLPQRVLAAVRKDTLAISIMAANNETGVCQPIAEIADGLSDDEIIYHTDAAQLFGKRLDALRHPRLDLISISGHKIYAPQGVGALIARRTRKAHKRLAPLLFGGGQERGLRAGTLPVALIAGFGKAVELAESDMESRKQTCLAIRQHILDTLCAYDVAYDINGDDSLSLPHVVNISVHGVDAEAAIVALKDLVAISNGSACTSERYELSHVLQAMGLSDDRIESALRLSWCHITPSFDFSPCAQRLADLQRY